MQAITRQPITTEQQAKEFLEWCLEIWGIGFHPDTNFQDYSGDGINAEEVPHAETRMNEVFEVLSDPYGFCLKWLADNPDKI